MGRRGYDTHIAELLRDRLQAVSHIDLKGAKCAEPVHLELWKEARRNHQEQVDSGQPTTCTCHNTGNRHNYRPDFEAYWWDTGSPDPAYARAVCVSCPVIRDCARKRTASDVGMWAGWVGSRRGVRGDG